MKNEITVEFDAIPENEGFARVTVAAFLTGLNPTLEEIADVKTAVSEAVTNSIIHGYPQKIGSEKVLIHAVIEDNEFRVSVKDFGVGIEDIKKAMEPLYTTKPEWERSGMGFAFMEAFMDSVEVLSVPENGTEIIMKKTISGGEEIVNKDLTEEQ